MDNKDPSNQNVCNDNSISLLSIDIISVETDIFSNYER